MRLQYNISKELRLMLTGDLQRYKAEVKMNDEEYTELCQWVQNGHSPYDNGWGIATDAGIPMDYISAKRIVESGVEVVAAYDTVNGEPIFLVPVNEDDTVDGDIPF